MHIIQFEPDDKHYRKQFMQLPFTLYRNDPNWVPPLQMEMKSVFNRKKHSFYTHGHAQFLLAIKDNQPVGRLMMLHNQGVDDETENTTGNFYFFEAINDDEVANQLFNSGIAWAKEHSLNRIYGPKGMTPLDGLGMLVRGFEHRPAFGMPYNPDYYPDFLKRYGFKILRTAESGYINAQDFVLPEKIFKAADLVQEKKGFSVRKLRTRKDLRDAISLLGVMYNASLIGTQGNRPLSQEDLSTMANGLLWIAQPELIKIIMKDETPIGFLLAYPEISKALQKTKGKIFPFGWLPVLIEKQRTEWVNINGIGVVEEYRGLAATALLFVELYRSITSSGQFKYGEVIQIGTENERMRQELRDMGIEFYKTHALFELEI